MGQTESANSDSAGNSGQSPQTAEQFIYDDDGVVIGVSHSDFSQGAQTDHSLPAQRWFDGPGPQGSSWFAGSGRPVTKGHPEYIQNTCSQMSSASPLIVWNRAPRPLAVMCGGTTTRLPSNHRTTFATLASVKVLVPDSNESLFEMDGLPSSSMVPAGQRTLVVIQEVGGVVTASMKYVAADVETRAVEKVPDAPAEAWKAPSDLEQRLNEAMQGGDEDAVRQILAEMDKSRK